MAKYTASAGSKLEYATTQGGTKTPIAGLQLFSNRRWTKIDNNFR